MFESAVSKVERADHHITELIAQFAAIVRDHPSGFRIDTDPETGKPVAKFVLGPPPTPLFAPIVGDAIHNLRSALDHLMWEMIGRDGGKQHRQLQFPIHRDRISFEAACKGIETPSQAIRDLLKSVEAFPSGKGHALYQVHALDNADKHHALAAVIRIVSLPAFDVLHADGTVHSQWRASLLGGGPSTEIPMLSRIEFPIGGKIKIKDDGKPTMSIFFANVETVPMEPVLPTLRSLREKVAETIDIVTRSIV